MAAEKKEQFNLYSKETRVLARIESVLAEGDSLSGSKLLEEYKFLCSKYQMLLKDSIKLTRVGDTAQRKLMHAKDEIDRKTEELSQKNQDLYRISVTDHLTKVFNRTYLMEVLARECARSGRGEAPLSVVLMDIDKFKVFNDTYGHLTGDYVLRETAQLVGQLVRQQDVFGRYGGEEFLLILPGTPLTAAGQVAEKVRHHVADASYQIEELSLSVTLSFGVAECVLFGTDSADVVIRKADEALYQAKEQGRNKVVLSSETPS